LLRFDESSHLQLGAARSDKCEIFVHKYLLFLIALASIAFGVCSPAFAQVSMTGARVLVQNAQEKSPA